MEATYVEWEKGIMADVLPWSGVYSRPYAYSIVSLSPNEFSYFQLISLFDSRRANMKKMRTRALASDGQSKP